MNLDRFTQKAQESIVAAQRLAEELQSPVLDSEHLLAALVEPDDGVPAETLRRVGVDLPAFRDGAGGGPQQAGPDPGRLAVRRSAVPTRRWSGPPTRRAASRTTTSPPSTC